MKCPFCEHIIRRKDEICNSCGKKYPRVRMRKSKFKCKDCGSYKIILEDDDEKK